MVRLGLVRVSLLYKSIYKKVDPKKVQRSRECRRAALTLGTKSLNFPKPFVGARRLENLPVVEHLIPLLPLLKDLVDVENCSERFSEPKFACAGRFI